MIDSGEIIRACRKFRGLTQAQLCRRSGVPKQTISGVERGRGCTLYTFNRLLDAMGFDIDIVAKEDLWKR